MSNRNPDKVLTSETCFDTSLPDSFFSQIVDIAKWSEDVSGAASPGLDFLCPVPTLEMSSSDGFEPKLDTASVYSMDSTYHSTSGTSRNGAPIPEGYNTFAPQETRNRMSTQLFGSDIYSPTLSSDTFTAFPEQPSDISHFQLPSAAGDLESGDNVFSYANYTTGQAYSPYTATSVPRYTSAGAVDMGFWNNGDNQTMATPLNFNTYIRSPLNVDAAIYPGQESPELVFAQPQPQRSIARPRIDTSARPSIARKSSSFVSHQQASRRLSGDPAYGGLVMSPASVISTHLPSAATAEFEQRQMFEANADFEGATPSSVGQSVLDDDDVLSPSDEAAAKDIEEEQGKIARSHPLYQAQPDESGKYHCPQEGKPGCNHKPTPLKCNYDKYVDSHLKPFRCNKKNCVGVQFSSTACLLRHEREAHGMHGHGSRPHLCHFRECDRSEPGNGFPRRYNLFDHMRRVHDYACPTTVPSPPGQQAARKGASRKRKATGDDSGERPTKAMKPTPQQQLQAKRGQLQAAFLTKKQNLINMLANLTGPSDLSDELQLAKEVFSLHEISTEFKKTTGG